MSEELKPYPAHKDSGVTWLGQVPEHWSMRRLKHTFRKIVGGSTPSSTEPTYWDGDVVWVTPEDVSRTEHLTTSRRLITHAGLASCSTEIVPKGSIIVTSRAPVGNVAVAGVPLCTNQGCKALVPDEGVMESSFAFLAVKTAKAELQSLATGTTFTEVSTTKISTLFLPLPSLDEQTAIVRYLNHADRKVRHAVRARQQLVKLLSEQKQAIIGRAVTRGLDPNVRLRPSGIPWLGDVPERWNTPLNQQVFREVIRPYSGVPEVQLSLSQQDGLIATSAMRERSLQTASYDNWKVAIPGDLVLNRFKAHLGVFFAATLRGIVSFHYGVFAPKRALNTRYFEMLFHTSTYRTIYAGSSNGMTVGLQNLSNQNFYDVRCIFPPVSEQDAITQYVDAVTVNVDKAIDAARREIDFLREYRARLIADVVTGKLDVRDAAAHLPDEPDEQPEPLDEEPVAEPGDPDTEESDGDQSGNESRDA